jgi:hypothetical protein
MRSGSGGGSISSNMTLLWHQLQLAAHQVRISSASTATAVDSAQSQHYKKLLAAFITAAQASDTCMHIYMHIIGTTTTSIMLRLYVRPMYACSIQLFLCA